MSLENSYQRWQQEAPRLFEEAPEAILVFDDDLRYLDANTAACQLLRRPKAQIIGKRVGELSGDAGARLAQRVAAAQGKIPVEENLVITFADGGRREIEVVTRPNVLPGVHVSFNRDVTERRQMQSALEHHNRLEAIGRAAGSVAHDFNNMLTAILSYTDLQLQRWPHDDAMRRYALGIRAAAERASETTQQLLAFCRRQEMQFAHLDLNAAIKQSADLIARLLGEKIRLRVELEPGLPPVVADAAQLNQVLVNLAVNARDAMPKGGELLFATTRGKADASNSGRGVDRHGDHVSVIVHDTGAGIDPEVLPHIFDPFYTTKPLGKGTGLGLSTVYGIVKQSRGEILVRSEPGRGTTFEIVLPAGSIDAPQSKSLADALPVRTPA